MPIPINDAPRLIAAALLALVPSAAFAERMLCPAPRPFEYARATPSATIGGTASAPVEAEAERVVTEGDVVTLEGDSTIRYRGGTLSAENARYDAASGELTVDGALRFAGEGVLLESENARFDLDDELFSTGRSHYELDVGGRRAAGAAERMARLEDGRFALDEASYSSCPPGDESWVLRAESIRIDRERGQGSARDIVLEFKGVPLVALPVFSFPVGPQRKSGFLAPTLGRNDNTGLELSVPWYWNIRPNLDATFTPRLMSRRGLQLQSELRYLNGQGRWTLDHEYLADRERDDERRSFVRLVHGGRFSPSLTSRIVAGEVSDRDYFDDLGNSLELASITHIERRAELVYERGPLTGLARLQGFQTVDEDIAAEDRPYRRLPQVALRYAPERRFGLAGELGAELVYFDRDDSVTGSRLDLQPRLSFPLGGEAWFVEPTFAHRFTHYRLNNLEPPFERELSRNVPTFAVDSGLYFDREHDEEGTLQTLEPRLYYLRVPHVEQDAIPLFDTSALDFNISQLFRENRFSGIDRIADTEQLSLALTTRFVDGADGSERLRASVGQIVYLADRRIVADGLGVPADATDTAASAEEGRRERSDLVGEVAAELPREWFARGSIQWNPDDDETVRGALLVGYRPPDGRLFSLAHRVVDAGGSADTEQVDLSALWPIGRSWRLAGRWNYSLDQDVSIESLFGVEYESCCWALRFAARRYVSSEGSVEDVEHDTSVYLQLVLKGLAPVGQNYGALLESAVLGYRDTLD